MNYFNVSCPRKTCLASIGQKCRDRSGKATSAHSARKLAATGKTKTERDTERTVRMRRREAYRDRPRDIPTAFETNRRRH